MQLADRMEARADVPSSWGRLFAAVVRRKPGTRDTQDAASAETLKQVIADLDHLNRHTEQDFLQIAGKLTGFMKAVKLISSELTGLADLLSGEQGLRASSALACALSRSREMSTRSEAGTQSLSSMCQEADKLKKTLSGFQGTVSTFHTIAVLVRVETARLGSAGADFGNLADDMRLLAGDVQARIESALDAATRLLPPIEKALKRVSGQQQGQAKELPRLIAEVLASLASFDEMRNRAHSSSVRLGARYAAISDEFTKLIVSIQFQDITRQQIEHVIEALRKLGSEEAEAGGTVSHDRRNFAAILALQSSQMADAGAKFASSVASVTGSLDVLVKHVQDMAGECQALTGHAEDDGNSFFLQMERGCAAILISLGECAEAADATIATGGGLSETTEQMRNSIQEIRAIEIQIQRMALNAGIRATLIGESGNALWVLAGSMQQLARESEQRSEILGESLGVMTEEARRLFSQDGSAPTTGGGALEGIRGAIEEWHSSGERSFARIVQIGVRSASLCQDVSETRNGFSVGPLFAEAISRARKMLKEVEIQTGSAVSHDETEASKGLSEFSSNYTMQAERDVHEGIIKAAGGAAAPGDQPELLEEAVGLEGSVEFF